MAEIVTDSFTAADDTLLSAHDPDVGDPYDYDDDGGVIRGGVLTTTGTDVANVRANPAPGGPDYSVSAVFLALVDSPAGIMEVRARIQGAWPNNDGYIGGYDSTTGWYIATTVLTSITMLVTHSGDLIPAGESRNVTLTVSGDTITLDVDGSQLLTTNDSTFTTAGQAALVMTALDDYHLAVDDFVVNDVPTGGEDPHVHLLTGRGQVDIDSPEWLSALITARPEWITFGNAEPANWYHVGLLSWGTDNGFMTAYPITHDLDLVQLPPGMTVLGYSLESGVTVTVTERSAP